MCAGSKARVEQHRRHVLRARKLIAFVAERPFMIPDWPRLARAAAAYGLFAGKRTYGDCGLILEKLWRKRHYWLSDEAESRYPKGDMIPVEVRGHLWSF